MAAPLWSLVKQEREALLTDLRTLTPTQWGTQSLCSGWSVRDVALHLLDSANTTPWSFLWGMARAGFDFDKQNQHGIDRYRDNDIEALLTQLAQAVHRTTAPPRFMVALESRLVEEIAHGEDIRRPLGITHRYTPEALQAAIKYQVATSKNFGGAKEYLHGVRLIATDLGWEHGSGAEIAGPALEILMALTGRNPRPGALTGPGLSNLPTLSNQ